MKNKSVNRILTANKLILAGLGIGVLYWILESAMHALVFHRGNLVERILAPGLSVILVRLLVMGLLLVLAVYAQFVITERKRAEEALRDSRRMLQTVLDSIPSTVFWKDRDSIYLGANRALLEAAGLKSAEEIVGKSDYDLPWGKKQADSFREDDRRVMESGIPEYDIVEPYLRADGTHAWAKTNKVPLRDAEGKVVGILGTSEDITERKRAEEALRQSEERHHAISEVISDYAYTHCVTPEEELRCEWLTESFTRVFGYAFEELDAPVDWSRVLYPDDMSVFRRHVERALSGQTDVSEFRFVTRKGEPRWLRNYAKPIWDEAQERVVRIYGAAQDITERKQAEEAMARAHNLLLALSQAAQAVQRAHTPDEVYHTVGDEVTRLGYHAAVFTLTDDREHLAFRYMTFRPTLVRRIGKLTGLSAQDFHFPLVPGSFFQRIIAEGEAAFSETFIEVIADALPLPVRSLAGRVAAMLGIEQGIVAPLTVGDETHGILAVTGAGLTETDVPAVTAFANQAAIAIENARLFEQVQAARERLRDLASYLQAAREEERAHIAREIHDEFGQALSALNMDLSWLSKRLPADQPGLAEKASAMSDLIDSTIQTMRRVATELRPGLLDDLGLAATMEWQAQEFAERTGIDCDLYLSDEEIVLDRDLATAIFRIFQETLTNVARHAEATEVHVELEDRPDELVLTVRDNGKGITESQLSDPRSLGLMGIRERAHSWGGEVAFQGIPGQGTTVTVRIPNAECGMRNSESSR